MFTTLVHIYVKTEFIEAFIKATHDNHICSIREDGNLRFDILQDAENEGRFVLYEAYTSQEAIDAHKQTVHYAKWRDTVAPWMEQPREGVRYKMLFPSFD